MHSHAAFVAHPRTTSCRSCKDGTGFDQPFSMAFQPIVDVRTGRPYAYEALVRGPAGEPAPSVLDQVEDCNRYGFDQACRVKAITKAVAAGLLDSNAKLSINFLPNAVYSPLACIQLTLRTAREHDLPLDRLVFEFTENEAMPDAAHVERIIHAYREIGFSIVIDDFGAGHAGLGLFARFHADAVKIDMELIRDIDTDQRRQTIVGAVARMCDQLGTMVVAEGVETAAEAKVLTDLGIYHHQGFYYARPAFETLPLI